MTRANISNLGNQTDAIDEVGSYKTEQFVETHKSKLVQSSIEALRKLGFDISNRTNEEYDRIKIWPQIFEDDIKQTLKKACTPREAASELKYLGLELIDSNFIKTLLEIEKTLNSTSRKIVLELKNLGLEMIDIKPLLKKWSEYFIQINEMEIIKKESDFPKVSGDPICVAIDSGGEAIVSRVLETKIDWLIDHLGEHIDKAMNEPALKNKDKNSSPTLKVILSDAKELSTIAQNESRTANERNKKLSPKRGISYNGKVTGVRHLALWSGTVRALSILKQSYPTVVSIYFKEGAPSERGNIAKIDGTTQAFCVEMREWEIGLDSDFYRIAERRRKRHFEKCTLQGITNDYSLDYIEGALEVAMDEEQKLLNEVVSGRRLGDVIAEKMKKSAGLQCWKWNENCEEGFVPWFRDLPLQSNSIDYIKVAQGLIESKILPSVRRDLNV